MPEASEAGPDLEASKRSANGISSSSSSIARTTAVAVAAAAITCAVTWFWARSTEQSAQREMEQSVLVNMLSHAAPKAAARNSFTDSDGDLVADTPTDESLLLQPDELVFSYIAGDFDPPPTQKNWEELLSAISDATGKPVRFTHFRTVDEQTAAIRAGEVHIVAMSTGATPMAVDTCGFVPLCTMGHDDGSYGYTMKIIARPDSGVGSLDELRGKRVVFVRPTSNSGFKAALDLLYSEHDLLPEQDYSWSFSLSHEGSVKEVLTGGADAAPVASDILAKLSESGEAPVESYMVLYESENFPPAAIGCPYNLSPSIVEPIKRALLEFDWAGTGLEQELGPMGATRFVPVTYKNDWSNTRRVDEAVRRLAKQPR